MVMRQPVLIPVLIETEAVSLSPRSHSDRQGTFWCLAETLKAYWWTCKANSSVLRSRDPDKTARQGRLKMGFSGPMTLSNRTQSFVVFIMTPNSPCVPEIFKLSLDSSLFIVCKRQSISSHSFVLCSRGLIMRKRTTGERHVAVMSPAIDSRTQSGYWGNSKCVWCFSLKVNTQPCSSMFLFESWGWRKIGEAVNWWVWLWHWAKRSVCLLSSQRGQDLIMAYGINNTWTDSQSKVRLPAITWWAVMLTRESRSWGKGKRGMGSRWFKATNVFNHW